MLNHRTIPDHSRTFGHSLVDKVVCQKVNTLRLLVEYHFLELMGTLSPIVKALIDSQNLEMGSGFLVAAGISVSVS